MTESARVAIRVAYDGTRFGGSQRQPGRRTVEGDLLDALARIGAVASPAEARFLAAGRTDRGVSAAGNVFAFDTRFAPEQLPRALNAHLEDAWVTGIARVSPEFNPRHAASRHYRYFLPKSSASVTLKALSAALSLFEGEHDFTSFARIETGRSPRRRIDRIRARAEGPFLAIDFEAPGFLWNQVRRVVAAALALARGETTAARVRDALAGKRREDFGLAPAEPLVLLAVKYDFEFAASARDAQAVDARLGERLEALELATARLRLFRVLVEPN